jgi:hypothetical protein
MYPAIKAKINCWRKRGTDKCAATESQDGGTWAKDKRVVRLNIAKMDSNLDNIIDSTSFKSP